MFLEQEIRLLYPLTHIRCNEKDEIGSELDFFFPDLKLAVELNGPLHYSPIYGQRKLDQILANDKQKAAKCLNRGIELVVVDVSNCSYLNKEKKQFFLDLFKSHIERKMVDRLGNAPS